MDIGKVDSLRREISQLKEINESLRSEIQQLKQTDYLLYLSEQNEKRNKFLEDVEEKKRKNDIEWDEFYNNFTRSHADKVKELNDKIDKKNMEYKKVIKEINEIQIVEINEDDEKIKKVFEEKKVLEAKNKEILKKIQEQLNENGEEFIVQMIQSYDQMNLEEEKIIKIHTREIRRLENILEIKEKQRRDKKYYEEAKSLYNKNKKLIYLLN